MWRRASALRNGVRADMSAQLAAVKRGYAYVVQNERGHFFSEGTTTTRRTAWPRTTPCMHDSRQYPSHAWIWWVAEDRRLSRRGAHAIQRALDEDALSAILIDSCDLPQPFHGDPADQSIVAPARHERAALVTKDRNIRRYAHVQTIW